MRDAGHKSSYGIAGEIDRGNVIYELASRLYPITRSISGAGVRASLAEIQKRISIDIHEVPTGTSVFDWTIPKEWNLRAAYIANSAGERIVDVAAHNLHVVSYSAPINTTMTLAELTPHLHSLPGQPDLIPYRTSYYKETWGFCLPHNQLQALPEDRYQVVIDATLADGAMTYGEFFKRGDSDEEVLLTAHICHPSLANDNCSGVSLLTQLASELATRGTRYSYRVLFAPGTIGAIAWLARNRDKVDRIRHGLVISNVGDAGGPVYKRSRRGDATIDRVAAHVLNNSAIKTAELRDFNPYGYDERQFCSPGFNLPVGSFQRSAWGEFPEYHTSADNLSFISPAHLSTSYRLIASILDTLEANVTYRNLQPFCEPQLGRHGVYEITGTPAEVHAYRMALLWVLNLSDGSNDLLAIAERSGLSFESVELAARRLRDVGLISA